MCRYWYEICIDCFIFFFISIHFLLSSRRIYVEGFREYNSREFMFFVNEAFIYQFWFYNEKKISVCVSLVSYNSFKSYHC